MHFLKNKDKKKNTEEKAYKKDQRSKLFHLLIFFIFFKFYHSEITEYSGRNAALEKPKLSAEAGRTSFQRWSLLWQLKL